MNTDRWTSKALAAAMQAGQRPKGRDEAEDGRPVRRTSPSQAAHPGTGPAGTVVCYTTVHGPQPVWMFAADRLPLGRRSGFIRTKAA
ncbi:MAG: hypothetical protein AAF311_11930 [Pseudomonadota bacterium]